MSNETPLIKHFWELYTSMSYFDRAYTKARDQRDEPPMDPDLNLLAVQDSLLDLIAMHLTSLGIEEELKQEQMSAASEQLKQQVAEMRKNTGTILRPNFVPPTGGGDGGPTSVN